MHSNYYQNSDDDEPKKIKKLRELKRQINLGRHSRINPISVVNTLESKMIDHPGTSAANIQELKLINQARFKDLLDECKKIKTSIANLEKELEIWTFESLIKLCSDYITNVIQRFKKNYQSKFKPTYIDNRNELYKTSLQEFLFALYSLSHILAPQFITPLMDEINALRKKLNLEISYPVQTLETSKNDFWMLCNNAEKEILQNNPGTVYSEEDLERENLTPSELSQWNYLQQEYQNHFDAYLVKIKTDNLECSEISHLLKAIIPGFDAILNSISKRISNLIDKLIEQMKEMAKAELAKRELTISTTVTPQEISDSTYTNDELLQKLSTTPINQDLSNPQALDKQLDQYNKKLASTIAEAKAQLGYLINYYGEKKSALKEDLSEPELELDEKNQLSTIYSKYLAKNEIVQNALDQLDFKPDEKVDDNTRNLLLAVTSQHKALSACAKILNTGQTTLVEDIKGRELKYIVVIVSLLLVVGFIVLPVLAIHSLVTKGTLNFFTPCSQRAIKVAGVIENVVTPGSKN